MKVEVHHMKDVTIETILTASRPAYKKRFMDGQYEHVATLELNCTHEFHAQDQAFELTNHITHPWWENPEVKFGKKGSRSTMSGDIFIIDGKEWLCLTYGWAEL